MNLVTYPEAILRKRAGPLRRVAAGDIRRLHDMLQLMYESHGVGLAGPQVGWGVRVLTMDVDGSGRGERIFINPRIIRSDGRIEDEEGCLSLPGIRASVPRCEQVVVRAYGIDGRPHEITAAGLAARVWQHEIDHLNGVLFIDKLSAAERLNLRNPLQALAEGRSPTASRHGKK